jgi:HSP20 family protein
MSNLTKREQRRGMEPWKDFFDMDFFSPRMPSFGSALPAVNLSEDANNFLVEVAAPGYKKEDFRLKVDDDVLTISAETKSEKTEGGNGREYSRREYSQSSFTRSFQLPDNAKDDQISARYNEGVLQITIPKSEKEVKASKEIKIE